MSRGQVVACAALLVACGGAQHRGDAPSVSEATRATEPPRVEEAEAIPAGPLSRSTPLAVSRAAGASCSAGHAYRWTMPEAAVPSVTATHVQLPSGVSCYSVAVQASGLCALSTEGRVLCAIGEASWQEVTLPQMALGLASMDDERTMFCARLADHELLCWGADLTPFVPFASLEAHALETVGPRSLCVLEADGQVLCWNHGDPSIRWPPRVPRLQSLVRGRACGVTRESGALACWTSARLAGDLVFLAGGSQSAAPSVFAELEDPFGSPMCGTHRSDRGLYCVGIAAGPDTPFDASYSDWGTRVDERELREAIGNGIALCGLRDEDVTCIYPRLEPGRGAATASMVVRIPRPAP